MAIYSIQGPTMYIRDNFDPRNVPPNALTVPRLTRVILTPLSTNNPKCLSHGMNLGSTWQLSDPSEMPSMVITDCDEWADKLGHTNFTIYPEPYVPDSFSLDACCQLRAGWDLARVNYTKHLARTREHYGAVS